MKKAIVFYSRTGFTKTVCRMLARELSADSYEIIDEKLRKGILGFPFCIFDALRKKKTKIQINNFNINNYDWVLVASPTWADNLTPAIRTFIEGSEFKNKKVVILATYITEDTSIADEIEFLIKKNGGNVINKFKMKTTKNLSGISENINKLAKKIK